MRLGNHVMNEVGLGLDLKLKVNRNFVQFELLKNVEELLLAVCVILPVTG